jgi:aminoglycoside phosphotransferase family enzyme/predicted kinase
MTSEKEHESIVCWLAVPTAYAHHPEGVVHIQTHISHVFLAGPYVYKLKKPVRYDFLDFSTMAAREHACREELRLNRRLAPETYLDVLPITRTADGSYRIGGTGRPLDWLVQMRRLPTEMTLDGLWRRGELHVAHVDRLAETLVSFYRCLMPLPLTPATYRERCLAHVRGNLRELIAAKHHLPRGGVERVHSFQLQLLLLEPAILEERVAQGRIVDGHGDLRPEHICLADRVTIFDCIEFNSDFRSIDAADELAFLAAECDFLGAEWVGPQLFKTYQQQSGDRPPAVLLDFYKSYRACVRAKVAALRADQVHGSEQCEFAAEARKHLAGAERYASHWVRPLVVVVGGIAGTGKTTLARALADAFGAEHLRTDAVRREMFGGKPHAAEIDEGIYDQEGRGRVYDDLFRRAATLHSDRISAVLDGTFSTAKLLRQAKALASDPRSIWLAIECVCPAELARQRIRHRLSLGRDPSDARPEVHEVQQQRWEPWPSDVTHIRVDTTQPLQEQVQQVVVQLKALAKE